MQVKDIMQTNVATVGADDEVSLAATTMAARRVSGLPVIDASGRVVGLLSEGDFLTRSELGRASSRSWWLDLVGAGESAADFVKAHAKFVKDAMITDVHTITPEASLATAAMAMESNGVKRLPVVLEDRLVGIVSRADIVRAFASLAPKTPEVASSDAKICSVLRKAITNEKSLAGLLVTVLARDGVVELWGLATTQAEIDAARIIAEQTPGVQSVEVQIRQFPTSYYA